MSDESQGIPDSERTMAALTHLSGLAGYIVPAGGVIVPIVIWMVRKDSAAITGIAKQAIWLNVVVFLSVVVGIALMLTLILIPIVILAWVVLGAIAIVLPIVGALKANQGLYLQVPGRGRRPGNGMIVVWLRCTATVALLTVAVNPAGAQDHAGHAVPADGAGWAWSWEAVATLHANVQQRRFTDFRQVESQNWFMAQGHRMRGAATLGLHAMLSLEPLTLRRLGSAQAFQTGEMLDGAPLVDYQHPHDLFMALEGSYERPLSTRARFFARVAPVGAAAFGPVAFMHRASAVGNHTAPLAHHHTDSAHISRSVLTAGVTEETTTFEVSTYKGREPDEDRLDLDLGVPDSVSVRIGWRSGSWGGQASIARVRDAEPLEPGHETKIAVSIDGSTDLIARKLAWTLLYGQVTASDAQTHAILAEGSLAASSTSIAYMRAELVDKNILTAGGLHPPGSTHADRYSRVGALTVGYEHDLLRFRLGRLALGGDVTLHVVPPELVESYGRPVSVHLGLRYRGGR